MVFYLFKADSTVERITLSRAERDVARSHDRKKICELMSHLMGCAEEEDIGVFYQFELFGREAKLFTLTHSHDPMEDFAENHRLNVLLCESSPNPDSYNVRYMQYNRIEFRGDIIVETYPIPEIVFENI